MHQLGKLDFIKDAETIKIHKTLTNRLLESEAILTNVQSQTQELALDTEILRNDLSSRRKQSENLLGRLNSLVKEIEVKETRADDSDERVTQLENKISHLMQTQKMETLRLNELNSQLEHAHSRYSGLHTDWVDLQKVIRLATGKTTDAKSLKLWFGQLRSYVGDQEVIKEKYHQALVEEKKKAQSTVQNYETRIKQTEATVTNLKAEYEKVVSEKENQQKDLQTLLESKEIEINELTILVKNLNIEAKALKHSHLSLASEITSAQNTDQDLKIARSELLTLQEKYDRSQLDSKELAQCNSQAAATILDLQNQMERSRIDADSSLHCLELENIQLQQINEQRNAALEAKTLEIQRLRQDCEAYTNRNAQLEELREASMRSAALEVEKIASRLVESSIKYTDLQQQFNLKAQSLAEITESHYALLAQQQTGAEQKNIIFEEMRKETQKLREDCAAHVIRNSSLQELQQSISENAALEVEKLTLRLAEVEAMYSQYREQYQIKLEQNHELNEQSQARERQLGHYAENLNKMKQELRDQLSRFDYELQMARSVNPINDYLKITEREIRRVELQLKKTPAISKDRLRLEECIEELFEQRDFLTTNARRSTTEIDERRARLSKILGTDALQASPPPPPRSFPSRDI